MNSLSDGISAVEQPGPGPGLVPIADDDRIVLWDLFRGISVLGILLANMPFMSMASALVKTSDVIGGQGPLDWLAFAFVRVVVDTKFITAFSFLFGAGLALLHDKASQRALSFAGIARRRLFALFGFGVLHGTLLWYNEILTSYALVGFLALLFVHRRVKTLVTWAIILLVLNAAIAAGLSALDPNASVELRTGPDGRQLDAQQSQALEIAEYARVFASGNFLAMLSARFELYAWGAFGLPLVFGARTLALFLLGMVAVRTRFLIDVAAHRQSFSRLAWIGLGLGLLLHVLSLAVGEQTPGSRVVSATALYIGGFVQCFAYLGLAALWSLGSRAPALRARLAAVGRMAFTNYVAQSVLAALIFNYLGLFDRVQRPAGLLIASAILALQIWWSPRWLQSFRMGPLEWLWRAITYWRFVPLRRSVTPALTTGTAS